MESQMKTFLFRFNRPRRAALWRNHVWCSDASGNSVSIGRAGPRFGGCSLLNIRNFPWKVSIGRAGPRFGGFGFPLLRKGIDQFQSAAPGRALEGRRVDSGSQSPQRFNRPRRAALWRTEGEVMLSCSFVSIGRAGPRFGGIRAKERAHAP